MLVTDWDMPGLDGLQLCRKLRRESLPFYVYILLLTAKSSSEEMVEGLDAGADDFISKPINPAVLLARLKAGSRSIAVDRRLRDIARLDPLTGSMNRRSFHERFSVEWDRASRYGHALSCAMIDLDHFKRINDMHGHAAGDAVLQGIACLLESHCRASDVLARYGGEEFCVLLTETDEPGAAAWAERTRLAITEARIPFAEQTLSVTASFGVAARLPDIANPEALVALADQALSVAKETGGGFQRP
jgi:two-component system chemotaxis response regulator CheY